MGVSATTFFRFKHDRTFRIILRRAYSRFLVRRVRSRKPWHALQPTRPYDRFRDGDWQTNNRRDAHTLREALEVVDGR